MVAAAVAAAVAPPTAVSRPAPAATPPVAIVVRPTPAAVAPPAPTPAAAAASRRPGEAPPIGSKLPAAAVPRPIAISVNAPAVVSNPTEAAVAPPVRVPIPAEAAANPPLIVPSAVDSAAPAPPAVANWAAWIPELVTAAVAARIELADIIELYCPEHVAVLALPAPTWFEEGVTGVRTGVTTVIGGAGVGVAECDICENRNVEIKKCILSLENFNVYINISL